MSQLTQKQVIELQKSKLISVVSFHKDTGLREMSYSGLRPVEALNWALIKMSQDLDVIFVDHIKNPSLSIAMEIQLQAKGERRRIRYDELKPYEMTRLF